MGGTAGVAVFLSIVYSVVGGKISDAFAGARGTAAFQAAAQAHPDQFKALTSASSGSAGTLNDTSFLSDLDPVLAHPFKVGFTNAVTVAFLVGAVVLVGAFVLAFFIKEVPLREQVARARERPLVPRTVRRRSTVGKWFPDVMSVLEPLRRAACR
ncbi:hypothetical protein [Streptomyces kaempferi]|uniref:Uncharacterized protein n=1 Tax=Streptomyces kaempferi TaxID=333725 RepID=A0ABW3XUW6_9ACTN